MGRSHGAEDLGRKGKVSKLPAAPRSETRTNLPRASAISICTLYLCCTSTSVEPRPQHLCLSKFAAVSRYCRRFRLSNSKHKHRRIVKINQIKESAWFPLCRCKMTRWSLPIPFVVHLPASFYFVQQRPSTLASHCLIRSKHTSPILASKCGYARI